MRMFSFKQLFNMFTTINNRSEVHDRLCNAEENIRDIYKKLQEHEEAREQLSQHTTARFEQTHEVIKQNKDEQALKNTEIEESILQVRQVLVQHKDSLNKINNSIKAMQTF